MLKPCWLQASLLFKQNRRLGLSDNLRRFQKGSAESLQLHGLMPSAAFVGSAAPPAGEYHDADFEWQDHLEALKELSPHILEDVQELTTAPEQSPSRVSDTFWEAFHVKDNGTSKFYKERRYLLLEFPQLMVQSPAQHFMEIGCGCGSSILPVLKANSTCRATVSDLSPTAVAMLKQGAQQAGIEPHRLVAFDLDAANPNLATKHGQNADGLMLVFTLAALPPADMHRLLVNAYQALKPGGLLFFRDHGVLDITHLRLPASRKVGHRMYQRGDGTLCYFFTPSDLEARMKAAGFETQVCKYACVQLNNRKQELKMRRVFIHGVFQKPLHESLLQ